MVFLRKASATADRSICWSGFLGFTSTRKGGAASSSRPGSQAPSSKAVAVRRVGWLDMGRRLAMASEVGGGLGQEEPPVLPELVERLVVVERRGEIGGAVDEVALQLQQPV